jgi:flagellar basal body L-ring protein FlgH
LRFGCLVIFILLGGVITSLTAKTIWRDRNIYSAGEELQVGDIITVVIEDVSRLRFDISVKSDTATQVASNPDVTITGFLPKISADKEITNNDTVAVSGRGDLRLDLAALITGRAANGNYNIQGSKQYIFNGVSNRFTISGIINPGLLKGRAIRSKDIVNFRLNIVGSKQGLGLTITRPPLKEGETVKTELTEQEKQQIVIDYLQKMIQELSR